MYSEYRIIEAQGIEEMVPKNKNTEHNLRSFYLSFEEWLEQEAPTGEPEKKRAKLEVGGAEHLGNNEEAQQTEDSDHGDQVRAEALSSVTCRRQPPG